MSELRKRMTEDLRVRNYSDSTIDQYIRVVRQIAEFYHKCPADLTQEEIRNYQVYLRQEKKVSWEVGNQTVCALRFLFRVTLGREDAVVERIAYARRAKKLPVVLSSDEVAALLSATRTLKHRTIMSTIYACGPRLEEVRSFQVRDIDSKRMLLLIRKGKGNKQRYVPLSPLLLDLLREYYKSEQPKLWLFPGQNPDRPLSGETIQKAVRRAAKIAGITKRVTPHLLRHTYATHSMEAGVDLRTLQILLGHGKLNTTSIYTHVSPERIQKTPSPFDLLGMNEEDEEGTAGVLAKLE
jgi:site-specific recombinase XerD